MGAGGSAPGAFARMMQQSLRWPGALLRFLFKPSAALSNLEIMRAGSAVRLCGVSTTGYRVSIRVHCARTFEGSAISGWLLAQDEHMTTQPETVARCAARRTPRRERCACGPAPFGFAPSPACLRVRCSCSPASRLPPGPAPTSRPPPVGGGFNLEPCIYLHASW